MAKWDEGSEKFAQTLKLLEDQGISEDVITSLHDQYRHVVDGWHNKHLELERFKIMFQFSPCTMSWIDKDLNYLGVNKAMCDLYGRDADYFVGKQAGSFTGQDYFRSFSKELFTMDEDSHSLELTAPVRGVDKSFYLVGTKFQEGQEAVIIGIEVTELVNLKKSVGLMERLSALGEMVAGIVHEIYNPLTVIKNRSLKITRLVEKEEYQQISYSSQSIEDTCDTIEDIIEGVKSFVRQGHNDPHGEFQFQKSLRQAILIVESKLKKAGIKVELPDDCDFKIFGNQTQLYQVFVNLLSNAIDALEEQMIEGNATSRWIKVQAKVNDNFLQFRFIDSGQGISRDKAKLIFDSFYTSKAPGKGTGIGLSLSRKIIEAHKGRLWIDHEHANTCFVIELPNRKAEAA